MPSPKPGRAVLQTAQRVFANTKSKAHPHGNLALASRKLKMDRSTLRAWLALDPDKSSDVAPTRAGLLRELQSILREQSGDLVRADYDRIVKHPGLYQKYWPSWTAFRNAGLKAVGIDPASVDRRQQRHRDVILDMRNEIVTLRRELNQAEDLRESVFRLAEAPIAPPAWRIDIKPGSSTPGVPILFCSDFQWGEVIRANELDGINAFNREIASRRYQKLIERTIDLATQHMVRPKYPGIVLVRGGDMISGDIHDELRKTNDLQSVPAALNLVEHESAGIRALAERFGRVWVVSLAGNHGRVTVKPEAKRYVETNYDYLIACMLEREFRNDERIAFHTPKSGDALFTVAGRRFLATHGDRIGSRGGQGFIGPAATITRGMKKLHDYYSSLGMMVDHQLVGHFHVALELEYGWSNGSLPGYSEYARDFRLRPQPPMQWLLFVHPKYGVTCRWPILLEPKAKLSEKTVVAFTAESARA